MKIFFALLICLFCFSPIFCQQSGWQQSGGPYGGACASVISCNGTLFASFNNNQTEGGIWKSNNSGTSWTDASGTLGVCYARDMECWNNLLVVSTGDSVFYSSNLGTTWSPLMNGVGLGDIITQLCIHNNELYGVLYKGTGESEIHKLTDTSAAWTYSNFQVPSSNFITDVVSTDSAVFICSNYSYNIYKSTDSGATWVNAGNNIAFNTTVQTLNGTGNTLYASTNNGIYMTTDGGALWMPANTGLQGTNSICFKMLVAGTVLYAAFNDYSSVCKITIGSSTWTPCNPIGFPAITVSYGIAQQSGIIFIGTLEGLYKSSNNCQNFAPSHTGIKSALASSVFKHNNVLLAGSSSMAGIQQSSNYGATWQTTTTLNNDFSKDFTFYNGLYYATSYNFGVIRSSDGLTWLASGTGLSAATHRFLNLGNKLVVATSSGIMESTNGTNWSAMGTGIPANSNMKIVVAAKTNLFALTNNIIYESVNGGVTWNIDTIGLKGYTAFNTLYTFKNYVYIFADYYTFRKHADSTTWQKINTYSYNNIADVTDNGQSMISASYTPFSISNDDGATWQTWNDGLPATFINSRSIIIDNDTAYAATEGISVWWRSLSPAIANVQSSNTTLCAGTTFTVTFNTNGAFDPGNAFYALLSDSNGSFVTADTVGTLFATAGGVIPCSVAANMPQGNHYRIRVISTMPVKLCGEYTVDLTVNAKTTIGLQPANQKTCEGINTAFYCSAVGNGLIYQWQLDNGGGFANLVANQNHANVNAPLLQIVNPDVTMDGNQYRCVITGTCGPAVTSNSATLSVSNNYPLVITQPVDTNICDFSSASFTADATGTNYTYQWQVDMGSGFFTNLSNSANYSGVTTSTLQLFNVPPAFSGYKYRCKFTECVYSNSATLGVYHTVVILQQPVSQITCTAGTVQFSTMAAGAAMQYQWEEDNGSGFLPLSNNAMYNGVNTNILLLINPTLAMNNYHYRCTITNACDGVSYNTADALLTVQPSNVSVTTQPVSVSTCVNSNALFYISATGSLSYQWQQKAGIAWNNLMDIGNVTGSNNDTLVFSNLLYPTIGDFIRCVVSGCTVSDSAILSVNDLPPVTLSPLGVVCANSPPFGLSGGQPAGGVYSGTGIINNIFYPAQAGNGAIPVSYLYTDINGCSNSATQFLIVDTCLAMQDIGAKALMVYPNPFANSIRIINNRGELYITVYDMEGKAVIQSMSGNEKIILDTEKLRCGIYLLNMYDGKNIVSKKIIKTR